MTPRIINPMPKFFMPTSPVINSRVKPPITAAKPKSMRRAGTPIAITVKIPFKLSMMSLVKIPTFSYLYSDLTFLHFFHIS